VSRQVAKAGVGGVLRPTYVAVDDDDEAALEVSPADLLHTALNADACVLPQPLRRGHGPKYALRRRTCGREHARPYRRSLQGTERAPGARG